VDVTKFAGFRILAVAVVLSATATFASGGQFHMPADRLSSVSQVVLTATLVDVEKNLKVLKKQYAKLKAQYGNDPSKAELLESIADQIQKLRELVRQERAKARQEASQEPQNENGNSDQAEPPENQQADPQVSQQIGDEEAAKEAKILELKKQIEVLRKSKAAQKAAAEQRRQKKAAHQAQEEINRQTTEEQVRARKIQELRSMVDALKRQKAEQAAANGVAMPGLPASMSVTPKSFDRLRYGSIAGIMTIKFQDGRSKQLTSYGNGPNYGSTDIMAARYQCVELIYRYAQLFGAIQQGSLGDGRVVAQHLAEQLPNFFRYEANGVSHYNDLPQLGSVLSLNSIQGLEHDVPEGHVGIVVGAQSVGGDEYTVTLFDQNWPAGTWKIISFSRDENSRWVGRMRNSNALSGFVSVAGWANVVNW